MEVYIENFITSNSFLQFEIGKKLELDVLTASIDYNPINENSIYFYNKEIGVEVTQKEGLMQSFDILMNNQDNDLFLGTNDSTKLNLNKCTLDTLISYLNFRNLSWQFDQIVFEKSISIAYYSKLKMSFSFDCDSDIHLSLIHISK